jgi:hypothetical protein
MFTQVNLQDLKAASGDWLPGLKFPIMFRGEKALSFPGQFLNHHRALVDRPRVQRFQMRLFRYCGQARFKLELPVTGKIL